MGTTGKLADLWTWLSREVCFFKATLWAWKLIWILLQGLKTKIQLQKVTTKLRVLGATAEILSRRTTFLLWTDSGTRACRWRSSTGAWQIWTISKTWKMRPKLQKVAARSEPQKVGQKSPRRCNNKICLAQILSKNQWLTCSLKISKTKALKKLGLKCIGILRILMCKQLILSLTNKPLISSQINSLLWIRMEKNEGK